MRGAMMKLLRVAMLSVILMGIVAAKDAQPVAADEKLEQRVNALATELRCLVCQNQTLADSNADLAVDLKNQIRDKLRGGASERDILDYMVARYGDFVLYRPPLKAATLLLWIGPFVAMVIGLFLLMRHLRGRRVAVTPLSDEERARAAAMLAGVEPGTASDKGGSL
ncbi:MAG: cytochrome c-type biogenesis protein [Burkholderiales bacterium]